MNRNFTTSTALKVTCYILMPIFGIIFILCIMYTGFALECSDDLAKENFYETSQFAYLFQSEIYSAFNEMNVNGNEMYNTYEFEQYSINYCRWNLYAHETNYVIVDTKTNEVFTNIGLSEKTDSFSKLKGIIINNDNKYWSYSSGDKKITTNINNYELDNIKYTRLENRLNKYPEYDVYICLNNNNDFRYGIYTGEQLFSIVKKLKWLPIIAVPISGIAMLVIFIYMCFAIGHKNGYDGIYQNLIDKLPIEITTFIASCGIIMFACFFEIGFPSNNSFEIITMIIIYMCVCLAIYAILAYFITIFIKKLKTKTLIKSSLAYRIVYSIFNFLKKIYNRVFGNFDINKKIVLGYISIILGCVLLCSMGGFGVFLCIVFLAYILYRLLGIVEQFESIKDGTKLIYDGDIETKIYIDELKGEFKKLGIYINDIAGGFSNAIENGLKSERLKTELITNVSHDIKTPLTSIINYVYLLKKEDIKDEKISEYIGILDNKSQRLKKLIDDLIDASKASSGNIKLTKEVIKVNELIKQTVGEFEDKFEAKNLEIIYNIPDFDVEILADSKYIYRVIENIYSNISKYALENSRVYIDITINNSKLYLSFKNISKYRLNISVDELMQRFVRGDKSRTTEGSGLGLSISKSLTELQDGKFDISIDGDLFKVNLVFDIVSKE